MVIAGNDKIRVSFHGARQNDGVIGIILHIDGFTALEGSYGMPDITDRTIQDPMKRNRISLDHPTRGHTADFSTLTMMLVDKKTKLL